MDIVPTQLGVMNSVNFYLGGRIDTLDRKAAVVMSACGIMLPLVAAYRGSSADPTGDSTLGATVLVVTLLVATIIVCVLSQRAKIGRGPDWISDMFSGAGDNAVAAKFFGYSAEELLKAWLSNQVLIASMIRRKAILNNVALAMFLLALVVYGGVLLGGLTGIYPRA